jgi:hypothetical protein
MPRAPKKRPATNKHVLVTWRPCDKPDTPDQWRTEPLFITSFTLNSGSLFLMARGVPMRIFGPGFWGDVTFIGEEPLD